eukprot:87673-Alexandrium_andersonii.AAC.1
MRAGTPFVKRLLGPWHCSISSIYRHPATTMVMAGEGILHGFGAIIATRAQGANRVRLHTFTFMVAERR